MCALEGIRQFDGIRSDRSIQKNAIRYMTTVPLALRENMKRGWRTTDGTENDSSLNIKESRACRGSFCFRKFPDKRGLLLQLFPKTLVTDLSATAAEFRNYNCIFSC